MEYNNESTFTKEELVREILSKDQDLDECDINEELIHELINGKVSRNVNNNKLTFGQKTADKIATFGGSWTFIISFCIILFFWVIGNAFILKNRAFDPYPFIFLNLMLSCLAALQAPIIMMSQNRQSQIDRQSAANAYLVNLKSEIIIEDLHYKLDGLKEELDQSKENQEILFEKIEELVRQCNSNK